MVSSWGQAWANDSRARVLYNGLDLTAFRQVPNPDGVRREFNIPADSVLCVHIGRFDPAKNHGHLLAIFAQLLKRNPSAHLMLIGGGSPDAESGSRTTLRRWVWLIALSSLGYGTTFPGCF